MSDLISNPRQRRGFFIVIEGIEGAGKTTQAKILEKKLKKDGYEVVRTREPGGTWLGEKIRKILLYCSKNLSNKAELALYLSARVQLVEEIIKPSLDDGKVVIADRFVHSTIAYQGYGRGLPLSDVKRMCLFIVGDVWPEIAFLIDIPPEMGLKRVKGFDRFESLSLDFHRRVRNGYLKISKERFFNMKVIDGTKGIEEISEAIFHGVIKAMKKRHETRRS